jgi:hypothetical protein
MGNNGLFVVIAPILIAICENKKIVYNMGLKKMKILRKLNFIATFFDILPSIFQQRNRDITMYYLIYKHLD